MQGFCEIISVDTNDLFFSFTPFTANADAHYLVTVALSGSSSVSFEMEKSQCGTWHFGRNAPRWIVGLQPELARAISSNR